jgi:undecaprenyl diphosphate synthase
VTKATNSEFPGECFLGSVRETLTESERDLLVRIDPARRPQHVAIIMDGNGRWAKQRGYLDRIRGHEAGIDSVRTAVRACGELGLRALTLYAFSVENWKRPRREVDALMGLLKRFLREEIPELMENNVRLVASGRLADLGADVRAELGRSMEATRTNTGLVLNLALSYGGRAEILDAVRAIAEAVRAGSLTPDQIDEQVFAKHLYHPELGDPDLLIRTSGEMRISNFLLWQIAYTELYVTPVLWPDFRRADLYRAILDYQRRERRFGGITQE